MAGIAATGMTAIAAPAVAGDASVRFGTGFDFSTGKFGDSESTDVLYIPATMKVAKGAWSFRLIVPYIRIEGPGTVIGGGDTGPIVRGPDSREVTVEDGLGDIVATAGYGFKKDIGGVFFDLSAKIKTPTGSVAKGLSTGKADITLQLDAARRFGKLSIFATAGYRFVGEPSAFKLKNTPLGSVGFGYQIVPRVSVGAFFDARGAASPTATDPRELTGFASWRLSKNLTLQLYSVLGLSDGSPDFGSGLQITKRF